MPQVERPNIGEFDQDDLDDYFNQPLEHSLADQQMVHYERELE